MSLTQYGFIKAKKPEFPKLHSGAGLYHAFIRRNTLRYCRPTDPSYRVTTFGVRIQPSPIPTVKAMYAVEFETHIDTTASSISLSAIKNYKTAIKLKSSLWSMKSAIKKMSLLLTGF